MSENVRRGGASRRAKIERTQLVVLQEAFIELTMKLEIEQ